MMVLFPTANGVMVPIMISGGSVGSGEPSKHEASLVSTDGVNVDVVVHSQDKDAAGKIINGIMESQDLKPREFKIKSFGEILFENVMGGALAILLFGFFACFVIMLIHAAGFIKFDTSLTLMQYVVRIGLIGWPIISLICSRCEFKEQKKIIEQSCNQQG